MRLCKNCGTELSDTKRKHAVFCDIKCKKQAEHKRRMSDPKKRKKNIERAKEWRSKNNDQAKAQIASWQRLNKARCREIGRRYSLSKRRACPPWLSESHIKEIETLYWLASDLKSVTGETYHVDHIVPLLSDHVCGLHVPWNLQVLPEDVNLSKGNRSWPSGWEVNEFLRI